MNELENKVEPFPHGRVRLDLEINLDSAKSLREVLNLLAGTWEKEVVKILGLSEKENPDDHYKDMYLEVGNKPRKTSIEFNLWATLLLKTKKQEEHYDYWLNNHFSYKLTKVDG